MDCHLFEIQTESPQFQEVELSALPDHAVVQILARLTKTLKRELGARTTIEQIPFSNRAMNVLRRSHIRTMRELSEWRGEFDQAGSKTYEEFRRELERAGLPYPPAIQGPRKHYASTI